MSFAVVQKRVDTEISLKLCALLALQVCAKGAQHHNKQKTTLQACKHLTKFAANLCRKVEFCRSTKEGRHFEISLKLCALLALQVCAKGAQHHNKQKTTLQACKHLAKIAANLCRKVEFCRSTKEGRHFEISLKLCALLALQVCAKGAQHHNKQKTTLQACKHLTKFATNLCRKVEFCRSTKESRHFEISLKLCALFALQVCAKGAQHNNKQKTTLQACTHLTKFAANLCRKVEFCRSTKEGRHFEISLKLCALLALQVCAKGAQHHNKQKTTLQACKHLTKFATNLCRKVEFCRSTKESRHFEISMKLCALFALQVCAKGAQHNNKQKTTLQACKHLAKFAVELCRKVEFCCSTKEGRHFEISLKLCAFWLYKFVQRVHNITTSKKTTLQACKHLTKFAANLCRKVEFCRSTKEGRHFEISLKLCALLALQVCAKGAQHHNKQKTTLQACKHLTKFAANLCRKVEFCRSTKEGRHFEISLKLCALLALQVCAKGAQHHNKQKTTLQACKHLTKFAANLCRKVEFCRSTKEGRHFEISLKLCALLALQVCVKGAQHHNKQKTTLQACKHIDKFAVELCRKVEFCRNTKEGRHFEISLKLCALLALQVCAKGAQHHNKQKTTLQACKHLTKFAANLCRKVEFCRSTKEGRHFEISLKLCALLALQVCAKGAQHHNQLYRLVNTLLNLP